jgi:hypothetical protein
MQSPLSPERGRTAAPGQAGRPGVAGPAALDPARQEGARRGVRIALAVLSLVLIVISIGLISAVALLGPSAGVPRMPSAYPWPLFYLHGNPTARFVTWSLWLAVVAGAAGVTSGLLAVRRGWRPRPRLLIAGSLIAVLGLMLLPPIGSTDLLDDAVYGRIAALGYSPYRMTPKEFKLTGDPISALAVKHWETYPSPYGPLMTVTQQAASDLGGDSGAKTMFWLKVWNALAFLAVALALDRMLRSDPAGRTRAHLLWTVNPLMLFAVMAGGHNDVLGVVFAVLAVAAFRRADFLNGVLAGALAGTAIVLKAPFALIGLGLAIAAIRRPRALAGLALGAAAVLLPTYALAGKQAVTSVISESGRAFNTYQPWQLLARIAPSVGSLSGANELAIAVTIVLAAILLWRMPSGPAEFPAVRPALMLTLAWLICSPSQRTWYDVMIFPLLALMPATRLDWIALARSAVTLIAQLPAIGTATTGFSWLPHAEQNLNTVLVPAALAVLAVLLVVLCLTGRITVRGDPVSARGAPRHAVPG